MLLRRDLLIASLSACTSLIACKREPRTEPRKLAVPPQEESPLQYLPPEKRAEANRNSRDALLLETAKEVEASLGARVGVYAFVDNETGAPTDHAEGLGYRAEERFALCSTFKWGLAAAVLSLVDGGKLGLGDVVPFTEADLLDYAPVAREHLAQGSMTVEQLSRAIIRLSDNTAANLLLHKIGGPPALTAYFASLGDDVTRLDRYEPVLNQHTPGDLRDTTTPRAMAHFAARTLQKGTLQSSSRTLLSDWLIASETGRRRLRAGFPQHLQSGDKTGSGENGTYNDVAVLWLSETQKIFVACYITGAKRASEEIDAAFHLLGRMAAKSML